MKNSQDTCTPEISVVIPVFKAEECLHELYRRLKIALEEVNRNFEIILVEDYGQDRSWEIITGFARQDNRVKGMQLSRNFGQHYAITAGLDHACGNWVVVMDCDLQDRPEEIPALYRKAQEGFDIVLARRGRRKDTLMKRLTSWVFYRVFSCLADIDYDWQVGNFRIMSRRVVESFGLMREKLRFFGGLMKWMGFQTASIEVEHAPRFGGKTSYSFRKLAALAVDTVIAYSDKPLRLSIQLGFLMAFLSFLVGGFFFTRAILYGSPIAGWSSLVVSLFFIGGIIIFNLGIIGIYLGKTFDETKKRPLYIVAKKVGYD